LDQEHYWRCNFIKKNIGDAVYLNHATFCESYAIFKPLNVSMSFNTGKVGGDIKITTSDGTDQRSTKTIASRENI
jgi:hypothetical protein